MGPIVTGIKPQQQATAYNGKSGGNSHQSAMMSTEFTMPDFGSNRPQMQPAAAKQFNMEMGGPSNAYKAQKKRVPAANHNQLRLGSANNKNNSNNVRRS